MKQRHALAGILMLAFALYAPAYATDKQIPTPPKTKPKPVEPAPAQPVKTGSKSGAISGSKSGAQAGAEAGAASESKAVGGGAEVKVDARPTLAADLDPSAVAKQRQEQLQKQAQQQGVNITGDGDTMVEGSKSLAVAVSLPGQQPLPALPAVICPSPEITQETQFGTIIGSVGRGSSKIDTSACVVLTTLERMKCRPRTVALAENALLEKSLPGLTLDKPDDSLKDLTAAECAALLAERAITTRNYDQRQYNSTYYAAPEPAQAQANAHAQAQVYTQGAAVAILECRKGQRRNSKGVCYTPVPPKPKSCQKELAECKSALATATTKK